MSSSATLRREVQDYARGLIHLLGNHIGVITKAAEPKSRAIYQEATLVQHDPAKDANWQPDSPQRDERPAPPVGEDKLFDEWRETGYKKRLLIVAPAGSGKSCLLESFALRMAKDLVDPQRWPEAEPYPTAVPVLVPLQHVGQSPLRAYFRESERDQNSSLPVLRSETVDQLRAQNRLLLMLDGYDEVPASQNQLNREIALLPDRLVLTTRPGHGEIHLGDGQWKRQTLEELTQKHAETYVAAYFQAAAVSPRDVGTVKQLWSDAWTTPFGRLLRRPLYLKAWCKYVFERLQSRQAPYAPESLGDLARIQLEEAFHYRPEARTALEEAPRLTLDEFTRWFGNLGRVFAHGGFRDLKRDELAKQGVFAPDQDQAGRQRDERLERVAKSCGWLASSATTHRYRIPKTPLVEYLIGKSLALDVENDPESPQVLIETFRWWIWRRNLHDILDYTFDALWNTGQDQQRIWADQLLEWAFQVGIAVEHPVSEEQASLKEDICHPFVMSVVRWGQLNRRPQADQLGALERNTKQVVQAIRMAVLTSLDNEILAYGLVTDQIPIIPLIQGMIDAHQRAQEDPRAPFAWRDPIRSAAGQVRAEDAAGLVLALIDAHKRAERDQSTQSAWRDAIRSAAKQVRAEDAARLVKEWINAHHRAEGDQTTQSAWRDAIGSGAGQVRAEDVARLVKEWIDAHHRAEGDQTTQSAWRDAIWSAAGQVRAEDAAGLVLVLIDAHKRTEGDQTSRSAWRNAIGRAAGQVRSDDASRLVQEWIDAYQRADGDSDAQSAWRIAILSAAGQVRMEDPAGLVRKWFDAHQKAKGDPEAQSDLCDAIRRAARQVRADAAAGLVREWIDAYQRADGDPDAQSAWRIAIEQAADRVRAEDAARLVQEWIDAHHRAEGDQTTQSAWRDAIWSAAGQVRAEDAAGLVRELIDAYQRAEAYSKAQFAWRFAIERAAGQVRDPNDGRESQSQPVIVETCQLLLTLGMLRAAYRIVRNHHGIALIWHRSGQQQEENDVEIQAVLRRDLILDPELLVPPPRIRAALIEAELSAMEASYAGGNPADQTQDVIERNTQALESLERQIGILGESTEWKSRSQQFKQRLNTLGNRLGFSEVSLQVSSNGDAHAEGKREAEASSRRINQAELDLLIRQHAIVLERLQMEINLDPEKETKNEALLRYFYEIGCQYKRPKSGESMGWVYTEIVARYANMRRNRTHVFHELSIKPATIFRLRKRIETHFCKLFDLPDDKTDRLFTRRAVQIGEKDTRDVTGLTPLGWFALKKTRRFLKTRRLIPRRIKKKS